MLDQVPDLAAARPAAMEAQLEDHDMSRPKRARPDFVMGIEKLPVVTPA